MNEAHADSSAPGLAGSKPQPERRGEGWPVAPKPPREGWSRRRWLIFIAIVFVVEVAIIFALGEKQFPPPRAVTNVPRLTLADSSSELIALDDPTLFALPHANDFASAVWGQMPAVLQPSFRWMEPPGELLSPADENLGAVFARFMQTNVFAPQTNNFKPEPKLSEPVLSLPPLFADASTLQIQGDLAQRKLLTPENLPSWPWADVIAPSKVQVLVDTAGNVVNVVLLEASGPELADTNALALARRLRFAPASRLTVGQLIFNWRTVAPPATNSPAAVP
jgi:TonB family protein